MRIHPKTSAVSLALALLAMPAWSGVAAQGQMVQRLRSWIWGLHLGSWLRHRDVWLVGLGWD